MQGEVEEIVLGEELIEHVGREDYGGRHRDADSGKTAGDATLAQEMANEGETAGFAAERAGTDAQET